MPTIFERINGALEGNDLSVRVTVQSETLSTLATTVAGLAQNPPDDLADLSSALQRLQGRTQVRQIIGWILRQPGDGGRQSRQSLRLDRDPHREVIPLQRAVNAFKDGRHGLFQLS